MSRGGGEKKWQRARVGSASIALSGGEGGVLSFGGGELRKLVSESEKKRREERENRRDTR